MFAEQRQEKIMQLLEKHNKVDVYSLSRMLSVSDATVRRDLEKLEKLGILYRTHGGAISVNKKTQLLNPAIEPEAKIEVQEINDIGSAAAKFLINHEVVAIGGGRLGLALAQNIDPNLVSTIITNDVAILLELLQYPGIDVIMTGGLARKKEEGHVFTTGEFAMKILDELHVNKAFLSVDGIDEDVGLSMKDFEYAHIWRKLKKISDKTIIMVTADAFNRREFVKLIPINEVDQVISSIKVGDKHKEYLFENGIPIHISHGI